MRIRLPLSSLLLCLLVGCGSSNTPVELAEPLPTNRFPQGKGSAAAKKTPQQAGSKLGQNKP